MKTTFLLFSAAGLIAYGGQGHAGVRDVNAYLQRASAVATSEIAAAGVEDGVRLTVKARVGSDGRLSGIYVVDSSGSLETDQKATRALRHIKVSLPPLDLIGAEVRLALGPQPITQAKTP
jgi:outer membrane biosynthesis protein TonB